MIPTYLKQKTELLGEAFKFLDRIKFFWGKYEAEVLWSVSVDHPIIPQRGQNGFSRTVDNELLDQWYPIYLFSMASVLHVLDVFLVP